MNRNLTCSTFSTYITFFLLITICGTGHAAPPHFVEIKNKAQFESLLENIDIPQNTNQLKYGYFLRRGTDELPAIDGFKILKSVLDKEPVVSKRWFYLQNIRGFAAFRVPEVDNAEGFAAYEAIFDHATEAFQAESLYQLRQSIDEYVVLIPGKFNDLVLQKDPRTRQDLVKAWRAYTRLLKLEGDAHPVNAPEPPFANAIKSTGLEEEITPDIEQALIDPTTRLSYVTLKTAASVLATQNPARAITLLYEAKLLLPHRKTKDGKEIIDLNESGHFYDALVTLLDSSGQRDAAIAAQEEMVKTTGRGLARLAELRTKAGNANAYTELVTQLSAADAPEPEIIAAAEMLAEQQRAADKAAKPGDAAKPDEKLSALQVSLLTKYLAAPRKREVAFELRARYMLGLIYINLKQPDAARAALKTDGLTVPPRGRAHYELKAVQQLRLSLEAPKKP